MTAASIWIKNPLACYDPVPEWHSETPPRAAGGGLVIRNGRISERLAAGQKPAAPVDEVVDASNCVVLPGLINTHHHYYQTLTRAVTRALNKPLFAWLTSLYPIWAKLTPAMIETSTRLAAAELLLSGCTTSVDHHYVFTRDLADAIDIQAQVAARSGVRNVLTRGSMSLGQSQGGLPPDAVVEDSETILRDSEDLIKRWHDPSAYAMCQVALAPCSPFSVTAELLRDTAQLAAHHNVGLHTHLAETADENDFCEAHFGCRPLAHLENCGWLTDATWLAHGIHFKAEEIRRLAEAQVGISHCPTSNMLLSSGICPAIELERAGVAVSLGVDGSASNDCSNLIQEVRQAMLLQRVGQTTQPLSHEAALNWATVGGARVLRRPELGHLQIGAAADLALFELTEPRFSGVENPLAGLILSGAHRASRVMVNGNWQVVGGELVNVDLDALAQEHHNLATQLLQTH